MQSNNPKRENEPKISELEEIFRVFKDTHGHNNLMDIIAGIKTRLTPKVKKITPQRSDIETHTNYVSEKKVPIKTVKKPSDFYKFFYDTKKYFFSTLRFIRKIYSFIRAKLKIKKYRYPAIALGVLVGIFVLFNLPTWYTRFSWKESDKNQQIIVKTQELVQKPTKDSAPLAAGEIVPQGSRLMIPAINVDAPVVFVSSRNEKKIQEGLQNGVVHYSGTATPGEIGNTFITGHSSNYWWAPGKYNNVFIFLDKLKAGDKAVAYHQGKKFIYTVKSKEVVSPKDFKILAQTDTPTMTLMTCTPPGTSWKRLVVRLDRTDPAYYKPTTVTKEKVINIAPPEGDKSTLWDKVISIFTPN